MESLVREVGWLMTEEDGGCGKTCVFRVGFYCLCIGEIESGRVEMEIALGDFLCVFLFVCHFAWDLTDVLRGFRREKREGKVVKIEAKNT